MTDLESRISEAFNSRGYSDIPTVYAYYTAEEKAGHGKHCESWTPFGKPAGAEPFKVGGERAFIAKVEAESPGKFASYLISWSGCD